MAVFRSFRNPWWFSSLLLPVLLLLLWPAPTIQQDADDPVLDLKLATYPTSINASWNSIKGATNYNITWIDTGSQNTECLVTTSDNTYTLDNLQPCTQYTVTVEAWNTTDLLVDEENVTRTLPEAPSAVSNLVVTQIDFEPELKVSWSSVEHNGTCILEYKVTWLDLNDTTTDSLDTVWLDEMKEHQYDRNEDSPYVFWMNGMDEYDDNFKSSYRTEYDFIEMVDNYNDTTNDTNYTITGLNYGDVYNVCVVASAEDEEADPSCKEELVEPPIYVTVTATPDGSYKINVGWTLDSNVTTQVKAYYMSWHAGNAGHTYINDATITSCTITGLVPCTYYTVVMQPFDAAGDDGNHVGGPGNDSTTTGTEAPYNVAVTMVTDQSDHLSVTWTPAQSSDRCNVASNIVSWWRDNSNDTADRIELSPTTEAYTITGLEPWTTYIVCVKAAHLSLEGGMACDTGTTDEDTPGPPINTSAEPESSSSIIVSWEPPIIPNGILTRYTVRWTLDSNDGTDGQQSLNATTLSYIVTNLIECTLYNISVLPATSKGDTTTPGVVQSSTETEAPPLPGPVVCQYPEAHKLKVVWTNSTSVCPVVRYLVHYEGQVLWSNNTDSNDTTTSVTSVILDDLIAWTAYSVCVQAQIFDDKVSVKKCCMETTKQAAPGKPGSLDKTGSDTNSISFTWTPPDQLNGQLTGYQITWGSSRKNITDPKETSTKISGLKAGSMYTIEVQAMTVGGIGRALVEDMRTKDKDVPVGAIVGGTLGGLVLLGLLVAAFVFKDRLGVAAHRWNQRVSQSQKKTERHSSSSSQSSLKLRPIQYNKTESDIEKRTFLRFVYDLEHDGGKSLGKEWTYLNSSTAPQSSISVALYPQNITKNHYPTFLPFDHSRVKLATLPGEPGSDYINASFIKDIEGKQLFVATQGPLDNTVDDFWRMVWELKVCTIIMLNNLTERGSVVCYEYWPGAHVGSRTHGDLSLHHQLQERGPLHTVRYLKIIKGGEERRVKQYHLTGWPDVGVPLSPDVLLNFTTVVRFNEPSSAAPILVHCSNGVGRTGVFLALWNVLAAIESSPASSTLNVRQAVLSLSLCRPYMVLNQIHYLYLYQCVAAYMITQHPDECEQLYEEPDKFIQRK